MALTQIDQSLISFNSLADLRRMSAANSTSTTATSTQSRDIESTANVDTSLTYRDHLRSRVRSMADANNEKVRLHHENQSAMSVMHKIGMLLTKTRRMLEKFGSEDFLTQKPGVLQNKIEKLIAKLTKIAEKANIDLSEIEDPIPDEIVPPETPPIEPTPTPEQDPTLETPPTDQVIPPETPVVGVADLIQPEPVPTPDVVTTPDTSMPPVTTDPSAVADPVAEPVTDPTLDIVQVDESQTDDLLTSGGLLLTIDSSLTRISDMEGNFKLEQYRIEGSLMYLGNPTQETDSQAQDTRGFTSINFLLETTRMQMMSDSGTSIYAQTMNFSFDIVGLLN